MCFREQIQYVLQRADLTCASEGRFNMGFREQIQHVLQRADSTCASESRFNMLALF